MWQLWGNARDVDLGVHGFWFNGGLVEDVGFMIVGFCEVVWVSVVQGI